AGLQARNQLLLLLLPLLLRPDHHKIHDDENENKRDEKRADAAAGHRSGRSRLSLSENHAEHIENWRAHLKNERARSNRSFARSFFWLKLNYSRNFFGTLEFAGRSQDCDAV